jgi:hypothetical protein
MKHKTIRYSCLFIICLVLLGASQAGDLEPPAPPGPTMVTLQQIYDRVTVTPVALATTGQTVCTNAAGVLVSCAGTGQDAEFQNGASISPRYNDNSDGTVTDNLTGLIWLKNANCFGTQRWADALTVSNALAAGACGLTDGSVAGDWRLPNMTEMLSIIDYGQYDPALTPGHPFIGVQDGDYWSSSTRVNFPTDAWSVVLIGGNVYIPRGKSNEWTVWPVRN